MLMFHARNLLSNLWNDVLECFVNPPPWWTRKDDKNAAEFLKKHMPPEGPPKITEPWRDWPVTMNMRFEDIFHVPRSKEALIHCAVCDTYSRVDEDCACKKRLPSE